MTKTDFDYRQCKSFQLHFLEMAALLPPYFKRPQLSFDAMHSLKTYVKLNVFSCTVCWYQKHRLTKVTLCYPFVRAGHVIICHNERLCLAFSHAKSHCPIPHCVETNDRDSERCRQFPRLLCNYTSAGVVDTISLLRAGCLWCQCSIMTRVSTLSIVNHPKQGDFGTYGNAFMYLYNGRF